MLSNFVQDIENDYEIKGILGKGAFGIVSEAFRKTDGLHCAIKKQIATSMKSEEQKYLLRELGILAKVQHPNCLQLIAFTLNPVPIIVTPYMAHGTLEDALKARFTRNPKYAGFNETKRMCSLYGICSAMAYLHSLSILHRDFKPANIFLNDDFDVVIADFGLSRSVQENANMTLNIGSPLFMAPELFTDDYETLTNALDVYAFGVTLLFYFSERVDRLDDGKGRIVSPQKLLLRIARGARFVRPPDMPDSFWNIYQKCSTDVVAERPSFQQLADMFETQEDLRLEGINVDEYLDYVQKLKAKTQSFLENPLASTSPPTQFSKSSGAKRGKHKRY